MPTGMANKHATAVSSIADRISFMMAVAPERGLFLQNTLQSKARPTTFLDRDLFRGVNQSEEMRYTA
jgi:hypothetical protein